jgi:hypothetical protein
MSPAFCDLARAFQPEINKDDWTKMQPLMPPVPNPKPKPKPIHEPGHEGHEEHEGHEGHEGQEPEHERGSEFGPSGKTGKPVPARVKKLLGPCRDFPCRHLTWADCKLAVQKIDTKELFAENKEWILHLCTMHSKKIPDETKTSSAIVDVIPVERNGKISIAAVYANGTKTKVAWSSLAATVRA